MNISNNKILYVVISYNEYIPKSFNFDDENEYDKDVIFPKVLSPTDNKLLYDPMSIIKKSYENKLQKDNIRLIGIYTNKEKAEQVKQSILVNSTIKTNVKILSWCGDL
jgi:hypothetical protein